MRLIVALVSVLGLTTVQQPPPLLEQVLETGVRRAVSRYSRTAYYIGADSPTGPEYDLVVGFAEELGVQLTMRPLRAVADLIPAVRSGEAHMVAAGLSITEDRLQQVNFSQPYQQGEQHLIYR